MIYFKELKIRNFRQFQNKEIYLGKYLTVISGRNSTGKSTILGMLGNSTELKKKFGETLTGKVFRADFSEIFKGSKQFDLPESDRFKISLCDDDGNCVDYRKFRTSWQGRGKNQERFRVIPSRIYTDENGKRKRTETKFDLPVFYLGLSRLYPIGETSDEKLEANSFKFIDEKDKKWFFDNYKTILSLHSSPGEITNYSIKGMSHKSGIGINTDKYDFLTNSSGQDNLGQILMALLSFRKLKGSNKEEWKGGLLLIDEIDATLHPAAQNRLLQLLISTCKETKMQIVFTTHSLSLLQNITDRIINNSNDDNANNIELYYLTYANRKLEFYRNPVYTVIKSDLLVNSVIQNSEKVKVYSEDAETRYFLHHLINDYEAYLNILDITIGCSELLDLCSKDPGYFCNNLIVLDGDVEDSKIDKLALPIKVSNNILRIPGNKRPEQIIYEYIIYNLDSEHSIWDTWRPMGLTWDYFNENGPESDNFKGKDREKYKEWFIEHEPYFNIAHLMDYWKKDNKELVDEFRKNFVKSYNGIAKRLFLPEIVER